MSRKSTAMEMSDLALYQRRPCVEFQKHAPSPMGVFLEIGSDIGCSVLRYLSDRLSCFAIGVDKSPYFGRGVENDRVISIEAVGERLPLCDESVDGIVSIATLEHVSDLGGLLKEVERVLRPGGIFFADYGPIWSGPVGHHVFAQAGKKEARFWKEGRNPIPDYHHLILNRDEMGQYLAEGPCDDSLLEPVLHWIYEQDNINRLFFEDYVREFKQSDLDVEIVAGRERHLNPKPSPQLLEKLHSMHGKRDYSSSYIDVLLRKPGKWLARDLKFDSKIELGQNILCCPSSGGHLVYSADQNGYISKDAGLIYTIDKGVPVMKPHLAKELPTSWR